MIARYRDLWVVCTALLPYMREKTPMYGGVLMYGDSMYGPSDSVY